MKKPIDNIKLSVLNGKGKVIRNGSTASILIDLPKQIQQQVTSGGGTSVSTLNYFWGIVITSLSYDTDEIDGQCTYEVIKYDDYDAYLAEPSSVTTYTPKIINNYNIDETSVTDDLREFVPWLDDGAVVPIVYFNLESEDPSSGDEPIDYDNLFFITSFSFTGDNEGKSISWSEDSGRIMAVYK